ncbi:MAG: hypothetical protein H6999_02390 [Hahellaceae bacterium]|nr:hypothetical protein [Hahellaceae bacterium]MCP5168591.1 hypothetical protein [Hahellaceae bacterium]
MAACFWLCLWGASWVQAQCSADYYGLAAINEVYRLSQGSNNRFYVEVKVLSASLTLAEYGNWKVKTCTLSGCSPAIPLSSTNTATFPWLVADEPLIGNKDYIDINGGTFVTLVDGNGDTIDYLRINGYGSPDPACTPAFNWDYATNNNNTKNVRREPDGAGGWIDSPGNSGGTTEGNDNNGGAATGPNISIADAAAFQGDNLGFTVSLSAAHSAVLTIQYATQDVSAVAGTDYTSQTGTLTIPAGAMSAVISVPTLASGNSTSVQMRLLLSSPSVGSLTGQLGTGTIYPTAVAEWRFEEFWKGSSGEVVDQTIHGLNGTARNGAATSVGTPARAGDPGTCRYGTFDGANQYVEVSDNTKLDLSNELTLTAWINPSQIPTGSGLKSILSKDTNYEFHLNSSREIYWWWNSSTGTAQSFTTTGANIQAGTWYHLALTYKNGEQKIYVNGVEKGSQTFAGRLLTNNRPLQIGQDQGAFGRYFSGSIDEVRIYGNGLPASLIMGIYQSTHPCVATGGCSQTFSDGISSHSHGSVTFGYNARLLNSPDNVLDVASVSQNGGSTTPSCNSANCSASGGVVSTLNLPAFPDTSVSSVNRSAFCIWIFCFDLALGDDGNQRYQRISATAGATINTSTYFSEYFIHRLELQSNTTLNLRPGDYWIDQLTLGSNVTINVIGAGTARVYVNQAMQFGYQNLVNSPSLNGAGDASKLLWIGYNDITLNSEATLSAALYSKQKATLISPSYLFGGVAAANIQLDSSAVVDYQPLGLGSVDFASLCSGGGCALGSFAITQPVYGLACPSSKAAISITAKCNDGSGTMSGYTGTINLSTNDNTHSKFYDAANNPISSYTFVAGDAGVTTTYLYHEAENASVIVTASDLAASVSSSANTGTDFRTSGFRIAQPADFMCGSNTTMTLTAIGQNDSNPGGACEVLTGFNGSKPFKVWFSGNQDQAESPPVADAMASLSLNGSLLGDQSLPAADNLSLTFNSGVSTLTVGYDAHVGQILGINFIHDASPYDGVVLNSLNASTHTFIVSPYSAYLKVNTAGADCATEDAACSKFVKAGAGFSHTVEMVCSDSDNADLTDNARAQQYQSNSNLTLTHTLVAPSLASGGVSGNLGVASVALTNGLATVATQSISEVGVFTLGIPASTYFGKAVAGFESPAIGRFYPDHFSVFSENTGQLKNACGGYSYTGQLESMASGAGTISYFTTLAAPAVSLPSVRITPFNALGVVTQNYFGAFQRLTANEITVTAPTDDLIANGLDGTTRMALQSSLQDGGLSEMLYSGERGHLKYEFSSSDRFYYVKNSNSLRPPFNPSFALTVSSILETTDGTTATNTPLSITPDGSGVEVRYGRWRMENAFGPETHALSMPAIAEFYSATQQWQTNTSDNCTRLSVNVPTDNLFLTPTPAGSGATPADAIPVGTATTNFSFNTLLGSGRGDFLFSPLSVTGQSGVVTIHADLSQTPWLKYDWDGNGSLDNSPDASITFGRYRGHDRIIYWREIDE